MASYQYIYVMKQLNKKFPSGRELFKNVSLSFFPGAKIGVLGVNGAGKSTLLKIMAGIETEFNGEAWSANGVSVGYLEQEPELDSSKDVEGNIMKGVGEVKALIDRFNDVSTRFAEPLEDDEMNNLLEEQGELQEKIDAVGGWELERTIEIAMDALRCPPGNADVTKLSGGERRRVALCQLLLQQPDLLLLDEPTNHLDAESVAWLERFLKDYEGTVVAITHDRYFLDNVAGWILELDRGHGIPYEGNYTSWLEQKQKRLEQEGKQEKARQRTLASELEWIGQSPRARQDKSKARISAYETLLAEAKEKSPDTAQINVPIGPRLGNLVIEAKGLRKGFEEKLLIEDLSFKLPPGGIVGVIGANGTGKTTLFRMIAGQDTPDTGSIKSEPNVWSIDQQKKVGQLSGGERNRVHLAKVLKFGANVILLDEPTNDLDVDTLRALEEALIDFPGCAVVISHDRWFLDRIATHILAFEGGSRVVWFEGNYDDYEKDWKRRLGPEAAQPHRVKYKPLTKS